MLLCNATTVISIPLNFVPFAGMVIAAAFRALGTARYLHEPVRPKLSIRRVLSVSLAITQSSLCDAAPIVL